MTKLSSGMAGFVDEAAIPPRCLAWPLSGGVRP
jgi:hypothetical protein